MAHTDSFKLESNLKEAIKEKVSNSEPKDLKLRDFSWVTNGLYRLFRSRRIQCFEESAESLRERSLKFYKGCRKYTEGLGEGYDGDIAFASALENFGGGHNDPISVAFGGPVMTKFTIALREIGTYKEVLRSQVEHMLNDRLLQFVNIDLLDVKEARKRFDKASLLYDQAREKFLSLRKGTKSDIATSLEEIVIILKSWGFSS